MDNTAVLYCPYLTPFSPLTKIREVGGKPDSELIRLIYKPKTILNSKQGTVIIFPSYNSFSCCENT